ncbi:MAG TPA: hypothetical protein VFJ90_04175, partial [Candidatus Didemnitutus sp.]|nr:hypothetical protein [Candidatus Didemnitutus sp.]
DSRRLGARIVIFSVLTVLFGAAAFNHLPSLAALGGGVLAGGLLALIGLHLTRFENTAEGEFYVPNTHIGVGLTILLAARVGYRIVVLALAPPMDGPPPSMFQSPLTFALIGLTAGYYIAYNTGLLVSGKRDIRAHSG